MTAQIHYDLDLMLFTLLPHIEYRDWELGHNEEHGRYMLSSTEHMQIVHSDECLCFALTLGRPLHDEFVTEVEDLGGNRMNFKLKLMNTNNLFFGHDTSDYYNPLVSCFQYGEAKKRNINIQIHIPKETLSMALAAAVVETVLCTL